MTRFFKALKLNFPDVTAYLISGIIIGPYCLGRLGIPGLGFNSLEQVQSMELYSTVALGFIAFSIGNEFRISHLKGIGKQAVVIGIWQAVAAMAIVDAVLILISLTIGKDVLPLSVAVTLGAIATATAPAATMMVVKQYKAHGELTDYLLPIVALDDAVGLFMFAISFGIAQAFASSSISFISVIVNPLIEIFASLALGAVMGEILTKLEKLFYSNTNRLNLTIAFVFFTIALSMLKFDIGVIEISFSSLLVCMMLGTVLCNRCDRSGDIFSRADKWTSPLMILFFVLSGAGLELSFFNNIGVILIGLVYIIARSLGKYYGAASSAALTGCSANVRKYLGFTLLPQAGVALGMCAQAVALGGQEGRMVRNVVLFAVFVYELFGPMITHWALVKSGDIVETPEEKKSHDRFVAPKSPHLHNKH